MHSSSSNNYKLSYIPSLEQLRGIACLLVFSNHFWWAIAFFFPENSLLKNIDANILGRTGVDLFFLLTGFLFSMLNPTSQQIPWHSFMCQRVFRIFPVYLVAAMFSLMYIQNTWGLTAYQIISVFTFSENVRQPQLFGALWSLGIEFPFYCLLPFIIPAMHSQGILKSISLLLLLLLLNILYVSNPLSSSVTLMHEVSFGSVSLFIFEGIIAAQVIRKLQNSFTITVEKTMGGILIIVSFVFLTTFLLMDPTNSLSILLKNDAYYFPLLLICPMTLIGFYLIHSIPTVLGVIIEKIGVISFSFYVFHAFVFHSIFNYLKENCFMVSIIPTWQDRYELVTLISFMGLLIVASASYYLIEKPFISIGKQFKNNKQP